ncbi:MAG: hypothetical protein ACE5ER_05675, partial [Nitrospinaceae bacterium]
MVTKSGRNLSKLTNNVYIPQATMIKDENVGELAEYFGISLGLRGESSKRMTSVMDFKNEVMEEASKTL